MERDGWKENDALEESLAQREGEWSTVVWKTSDFVVLLSM